MKFQFALLLIFSFLLSSSLTAQQMSKEEQKKWKTAAKAYRKDLNSLKTLVEERDQFQLDAQQARQELIDFRNSQTESANRAMQMEQEIKRLNQELAAARQGTASTKTRSQVRGGGRKPWRQSSSSRRTCWEWGRRIPDGPSVG